MNDPRQAMPGQTPQPFAGPYPPSSGYVPPPGYTPPPMPQPGTAPAAPPKQRAPLYLSCAALGIALVALAASVAALVKDDGGGAQTASASAAPGAETTGVALHHLKLPDSLPNVVKTAKWSAADVQKAIGNVAGPGETAVGTLYVDDDTRPSRMLAVETIESPKPFDSPEAKLDAIAAEAVLPVGTTVDVKQSARQQQDAGPLGGTVTCWTVTTTDETNGNRLTIAIPACMWASVNVAGLVFDMRTTTATTDITALAQFTRQYRQDYETAG